ncbi:MAG: hypothetical protein P8I29_03795 [Flavobacteriales bacterium]|jgi:hypothetical protein|nr:hypothetical protein [Flavobacteriales bacterium]|tara:strand:+ start:2118 stop:2744 length:627 start_codon:yes stop_codon:yes gene_type:complete
MKIMNRKTIQLILWPVIIILAWLVYRSPISLKEFQEETNYRKSAVVQDLKDIRTAQIAFKDKYRVYAGDFNSLLSFVKNDSLAVVKAIGETPDSLTESQALSAGIISRDTVFVPAYQTIFNQDYLDTRDSRFPFDLDKLPIVPFSDEMFNIESGNIEKGKVVVQVFEVSTTYTTFLNGLDATNKGIDLNNIIRVGSMSEVSINGNWGE